MFAKGVIGGYSPKKETLALIREVRCVKQSYGETSWYEVYVGEKRIGQAASAVEAWKQAHGWAMVQREQKLEKC